MLLFGICFLLYFIKLSASIVFYDWMSFRINFCYEWKRSFTCSRCFSFDNGDFHVFDFYTNKKKIYFTNNYIFQMISENINDMSQLAKV